MSLETEVLIVGAGPSGLTLGADLARLGVKIRIIDTNSARSVHSKALGVQAGTLESLKNNFGKSFVDGMVHAGNPVLSAVVHFEGNPVKVDLSVIPSVHNYILILHQSETERLLEEEMGRFGVQVERESTFVSLAQSSGGVRSIIRDKHGNKHEIKSAFVVGCDGAHSAVRADLNFPFKGGVYNGEFVLGDVEMTWAFKDNAVHAFPSSKGAIVFFPMTDERYRIIYLLKAQHEGDSQDIELNEFKRLVGELCPESIEIKRAVWLTRFRVHHRMTRRFQDERIFLVGDSAHIHSPAGGQGMNTGIQDALNLSHKLNLVLRNGSPREILDQYEKERIPVARNVLLGTDLLFKRLLEREGWFTRFLRTHVAHHIIGVPFIQRQIVYMVSELRVARREIRSRQSA